MDANNQEFRLKEEKLTHKVRNPLYETLRPLYDRSPDIKSYAMYNDQEPPKKNADQSLAHSKGALAFDSTMGFWMISSIPRFPAKVSLGFQFSSSQTLYGQTVFCITVSVSVKNRIKTMFEITHPNIYDEKDFMTKYINLEFETYGKVKVQAFAKSAMFGKDIYTDMISPGLGSSKLFVQTWRPKLKNNTMVSNIEYIQFKNTISYKASNDHSKWAVAEKRPWTCIGDINREETQFRRGGLSLCLNNKNVADQFRNLLKLDTIPILGKRKHSRK